MPQHQNHEPVPDLPQATPLNGAIEEQLQLEMPPTIDAVAPQQDAPLAGDEGKRPRYRIAEEGVYKTGEDGKERRMIFGRDPQPQKPRYRIDGQGRTYKIGLNGREYLVLRVDSERPKLPRLTGSTSNEASDQQSETPRERTGSFLARALRRRR